MSDDDMHYLRSNLEVSIDPGPTDPQAQRVYSVQANVIDFEMPVWRAAEVESEVRAFAERSRLRIKLRWRELNGGCCFVGRGGATILLNADHNSGSYRLVRKGEHIAALVVHELAHALTPNRWHRPGRYNSIAFPSHGPEFVRCYLDLLAEHIDTEKAVAAFEFLGVDIAPEGAPCRQGGCL